MVTSNCFLIVNEELVKSTSETFFLGNLVNKVLSLEAWNCEVSILKLDGLIETVGNPPSHIPVTVVNPAIVNECWETLSTLAYDVVLNPELVYSTILPTVAIPLKNLLGSVLVTVEIPRYAPSVVATLILTSPIWNKLLCFTSALKVLAVLTVPLIDLISLVV